MFTNCHVLYKIHCMYKLIKSLGQLLSTHEQMKTEVTLLVSGTVKIQNQPDLSLYS